MSISKLRHWTGKSIVLDIKLLLLLLLSQNFKKNFFIGADNLLSMEAVPTYTPTHNMRVPCQHNVIKLFSIC